MTYSYDRYRACRIARLILGLGPFGHMRACGPSRHMEECSESHNTIRVVRLGTVILIHITVYIVYAPLWRLFFRPVQAAKACDRPARACMGRPRARNSASLPLVFGPWHAHDMSALGCHAHGGRGDPGRRCRGSMKSAVFRAPGGHARDHDICMRA